MKIKKEKNNKKKNNLFYKILSILLILMVVVFEGILIYVDLLPMKYMLIISIVLFLFTLFNVFLLNLKKLKRKIKKVLSIIIILVILFFAAASFYVFRTLGVLLNNGDSKYKLENYSVVVLKSSEYNDVNDIKDLSVGYFKNSLGTEEAKKSLDNKVNVNFETYDSSNCLMEDLMNSKVEVIMIEDSVKEIMEEESKQFKKSTKTIYTFKIKVAVESTLKDVDVTKEAFAIYLSGIDTYGEISSVSRSDVNMLAVVNPEINQILLISIPRDYYVQLHGTTGTKDKLTHAGIYGIDMSIQTIEDLLELDINYYFKVNFTSVIDIVDALGGLDVYSEYSFISYSGYSFKKGLNRVNGKQALDFARTRKAFVDGDRQRGKNQQALIEALVRKATDASIITKYNSLLNAINGKYQTNMSIKKITSLIKMQLKDMKSWNITSHSLTGSDSSNYTYTYNQLLYVMEPDSESITTAIDLIDKVLSGQQLESSYTEVSGESNTVIQVGKPKKKKEESKPKEEVKKPEITNKYTIKFDSKGGSNIDNQIVEEKSNVLEPSTPTKEGYIFVGWYLNGEKYDFSSSITKDIILTAEWKEEIVNEESKEEIEQDDEKNKIPENSDQSNEEQIEENKKDPTPSIEESQENSSDQKKNSENNLN